MNITCIICVPECCWSSGVASIISNNLFFVQCGQLLILRVVERNALQIMTFVSLGHSRTRREAPCLSDTNPKLVPFFPSCCRADDGSQPNPYFGQKYLGVSKGGTLEIHGKKKLSWTFLNKTLHPGGLEEGGYYFERSWGHRGVIVHVIDPKTGAVVHSDRWVTFQLSRSEDLWEQVGDSVSVNSKTPISASCSNGCYCMYTQFFLDQ